MYGVYSDQGTPEVPPVPLLALRGRLEDGAPDGPFDFFDPQGRPIWQESRYWRGSACGSWTFVHDTDDARGAEPGEGFEERWFSWVAPGLAPGGSTSVGATPSTYPPCPINTLTGDPLSGPTPPWEATR